MDMDYGMRVVYKVQRLECSYYRYLLQWLSCQSYVIDLASQWELAFSSLSLSLSLSPSANQLLLPFSAMGCAGSSQSKPDGEPPLLFIPLKPFLCIPFSLNLYQFHHGSLSKSILSCSCFMGCWYLSTIICSDSKKL